MKMEIEMRDKARPGVSVNYEKGHGCIFIRYRDGIQQRLDPVSKIRITVNAFHFCNKNIESLC